MKKKVVLSKAVFEKIVESVANIEERKEKILQEFFPEPSKERSEIKEMLDQYILHIDELLKNVVVQEKGDNALPFVIINSEVEILDAETKELLNLRIISPVEKEVQVDDVSCISPLGRALLLKKAGDEVKVSAPAGTFGYQIQSIKIPFY